MVVEKNGLLMCKHPAILAPAKGCSFAYFSLVNMSPGISISASSISRRPKAARLMSATLDLCAGTLIFGYWIVLLQACAVASGIREEHAIG